MFIEHPSLQGWPNRSSVKIMTSWFRWGEKTWFTMSMQYIMREKSGDETRILNF